MQATLLTNWVLDIFPKTINPRILEKTISLTSHQKYFQRQLYVMSKTLPTQGVNFCCDTYDITYLQHQLYKLKRHENIM
jgi:hypothetical protein